MATIKVNPDKLRNDAKRIENSIDSYNKVYKIMVNIIKGNAGGFDKATQASLLQSCEKMEKQFKDMEAYLKNVVTVTRNVATEYDKANDAAGKKTLNITI